MNTVDIVGNSIVSSIIDKEITLLKKDNRIKEARENKRITNVVKISELKKAYMASYKKLYTDMADRISLMKLTEPQRNKMLESGRDDIIKALVGKEKGCKKWIGHVADILISVPFQFFLTIVLDIPIFNIFKTPPPDDGILLLWIFAMCGMLIPVFIITISCGMLIEKIINGRKCTCQKCLLKKSVIPRYSKKIW